MKFGEKVVGKCSYFGGPSDNGVTESEGLALFESHHQMPQIFLKYQPTGTTGLARRLDPDKMYIAMRWDYDITPKEVLRRSIVKVDNPKNGKHVYAIPCDWGPNGRTGRIADLSPGVMKYLSLQTDDVVECTLIDVKVV